MLLSRESDVIEVGELGLSLAEVLRYLNYCGVPGEYVGGAECAMPASAALAVFEAFEALLEVNHSCLAGVFVNLGARECVTCKVTLEGLTVPLAAPQIERLQAAGVTCCGEQEDGVTYLCFTMPRGGQTP